MLKNFAIETRDRPKRGGAWVLLWGLVCALAVAGGQSAHSEDKPKDAFIETVTEKFSDWDTDKDHILSEQEIDAAIQDSDNRGPAAAALAALRRAQTSQETNYTLPPLTLDNIRELADGAPVTNQPNLHALYRRSLQRINRVTSRELFASGLPQLNTIHQGSMGNCFCLAPLGAMVNRDPHEVAGMFSNQTDGQILVKFGGGNVTIAPPTDGELAITSGNSHDGIWINLFEKAIAEARNEEKPEDKQADLTIDAIAHGGSERIILSHLTGHKVKSFGLGFGKNTSLPEKEREAKMAELRDRLTTSVKQKRLMVCGTEKVTTPGLTPKHAYAMLNYAAQSDTVEIWNPHGNHFTPKGPAGLTNGYATTNGVFTVPLTEFVQQFSHAVFELPETTSLRWLDEWPLLAKAGKFKEAAADLKEIVGDDTMDYRSSYMLTALLAQLGDMADYKTHCKTMLEHFGTNMTARVCEGTAKTCLLLPGVVGPEDFALACKVADNAVNFSKKGEMMHWRLLTQGLAEYRQGHFTNAVSKLELSRGAAKREREAASDICRVDTYLISAMAFQQLKEPEKAHDALTRGVEIAGVELPKIDSGDLGETWYDVLMSDALMREAKEMVEGAGQK